MEERPAASEQAQAPYDIFLCTRELPDQLTGETAALRQLCSALAGDGYRVFFPSALSRELTDEQRAEAIVEALRSARVMVAAGIGTEGLTDPVSRKLWSAFRQEGDRPFFLCWREQGDAPFPEELTGLEALDMSELTFLAKLKEQLSAALPVREVPEPVPEEPAEEEPAEELPPETPAGPVPAKKPFPWKWLLLAAAVLVLILLLKKR